MRRQVEARLATLRAKVDRYMRKIQARYKSDYDGRVREIPPLPVGQYIFLDKPPIVATPELAADSLAKSTYGKLQKRTTRTFCITIVQQRIFRIEKHGILNTVSNVWATHAPTSAVQSKNAQGNAHQSKERFHQSRSQIAQITTLCCRHSAKYRIVPKIGRHTAHATHVIALTSNRQRRISIVRILKTIVAISKNRTRQN